MSVFERRNTAHERLDVAVASCVPDTSRTAAARLIRAGRVAVDGQTIVRPGVTIQQGCQLRIDLPKAAPATACAQDLPLSIVYEDEDVAVIDKAAGMVVHPAAGHPDRTLMNALLHHFEGRSIIGGVERPGLVHRLDAGTSGLMVVAKGDVAHRHLSEQFAEHSAGRTYLALVHAPPAAASGTAESWLAPDPRHRKRYASSPRRGTEGRWAVTRWELLADREGVGLMCCLLQTGRTHQVRVHLSELGCAILGDVLYAGPNAKLPTQLLGMVERPMLHAWRLHFIHPRSGQLLALCAPPPRDFQAILDVLSVVIPS